MMCAFNIDVVMSMYGNQMTTRRHARAHRHEEYEYFRSKFAGNFVRLLFGDSHRKVL